MIFDDVIFTVFKLIHPSNVWCSIDVTLGGIDMDVNDSQLSKAPLPIELTEYGIVIDRRSLQPSKA